LSELRFPSVIVNFKTYREVDGDRTLEISKICDDVSRETGVSIVICPPMAHLANVVSNVSIPVVSQHVDPLQPGSHTGWITPSMIEKAGANGSLINHSEHQMVDGDISQCISLCRELNLFSIVCADTAETAGRLASMAPDSIAVEPPELIGGNVSVTTAKPEVVSDAVDAVHSVDESVRVLCGAGVKNGKDVRKALELGANGVLLASGVVKASSIEGSLRDLIKYI
jgi:triosephosphate isomerase (TIM)